MSRSRLGPDPLLVAVLTLTRPSSGLSPNTNGLVSTTTLVLFMISLSLKKERWEKVSYRLSCGLGMAGSEWDRTVQYGGWRTEGWRSQRGYWFSGQTVRVRDSCPEMNFPSQTAVCIPRIHFLSAEPLWGHVNTYTKGHMVFDIHKTSFKEMFQVNHCSKK